MSPDESHRARWQSCLWDARRREWNREAKARPASERPPPIGEIEDAIARKRRHYEALQQVHRPGPQTATFRLRGVLTAEKAKALISRLDRAANALSVTLLIDSPGGSVSASVDLYVAIAAHPRGVVTIARGLCASAAVTVFAAGKRRRASARAQFLLHASAIEGRMDERLTADCLERALRVARIADRESLACLMRSTKRTADAVLSYMTDRRESPTHMRSLGLVTEPPDPSPSGIAAIEQAWARAAIGE